MKKVLFGVLVVSALASCGGGKGGVKAQGDEADTTTLVLKGDTAPLFEVLDMQGVAFNSAELKGNYALLVFFATWCPYCRMELPEVQELYNEYGNEPNFKLLVIGCRQREPVAEQSAALTAFAQKNNYTFPLYVDTAKVAFSQFAKRGIPRTFLLDTAGIVIESTYGFEIVDTVTNESNFGVIQKEMERIFR
jgi:cytochrome c-type biogenesis protein